MAEVRLHNEFKRALKECGLRWLDARGPDPHGLIVMWT